VVAINGQSIESFLDMKTIVSMNAGVPLDVVVERAGTKVTLHATPRLTKEKDVFGNVQSVGLLGVRPSKDPDDVRATKFSPPGAVWEATKEIWLIVDRTFTYVSRLLVGRASTDEIGGVIRIAKMSGEAASMGFSMLMNFAAVISVSIGLLNLFPIPLLDGGHLLFYVIEAVRGRPVSERVLEVGFRIGLAIIGIPSSFILGIQAGLLAFIPTLGALIGGLIVVLASLASGWIAAASAFVLFLGVHALESYVLTPIIQRQALDIPPATLFAFQILLGVVFGLWGLALALPLIAIAKVVIDDVRTEGAAAV